MNEFKDLANAGIAGVAISLILMVCYLGKLVGNHLTHLNDTLITMVRVTQKLSSSIDDLRRHIKNNKIK